mgnify:CR=1 FL=1
MTKLTDEQKQLFSYIDQLIPGDGHLAYDFNDQKQYEFARMMIELSGKSDKYPGMLKSLALMQSSHKSNSAPKPMAGDTDGWQNMFTIPGLNLTQSGTIASNGLATVVGGYSSMDLTLIIQSKKSKNIVAAGFSNNFTQTLLTVNTAPSKSTEIDVDAYMHYHGISSGPAMNETHLFGVVKRKGNNTVTGDPTVIVPKRETQHPNNPNAINIGLGRGWTDQGYPAGSGGNPNSQFDYAWNEPTPAAGENPKGKIPFIGSVTFSNQISSPLEFNTNFLLNIYVVDQNDGGGAQLNPTDSANVANAFSIDSSNLAKLNWNLSPGTSTSDPGNPIVFGNVPWGPDTSAYFFCEIDVVLQDGSISSAYIQSSDSPDTTPLDGTTYIMPIDFIWHCLAENTLVTMADGSKKIIKDIVAGNKVQINHNDDLAVVEWTNLGTHKGLIIDITTDNGENIKTSHNHVFFTENTSKLASEIKLGDKLKMRQGLATVKNIRQSNHEGLMCNLATVKYQNPKHDKAEIGVFYANDFLVGDINAQRVIRQRRLNDIDWVKNQVPEYMHADVDSYFAERN